MRQCIDCESIQPLTAFPSFVHNKTQVRYYRYQCKTCYSSDIRAGHVVKKEQYIRERGGRCQRCGDVRPWVMDFHHDPPRQGESDTIPFSMSMENIREKFKDLHMLCANCHREAHYLMSKTYERKMRDIQKKASKPTAKDSPLPVGNGRPVHPVISLDELRGRKTRSKD